MIRLFYNLLYPIGLLLFLPGQISKLIRRGNYRHKFGQRFGVYDRDGADATGLSPVHLDSRGQRG